MTEDLIQLPDVADIKEMLELARRDIETEIQQDPEAKQASELILQVLDVINSKVSKHKSLEKLSTLEKIDLAAHLNFVQSLLEDFFMFGDDEDFDDEDFDDEEFDDEDFEDEDK